MIRPLAGWAAVGGLYGWSVAAIPLPEPSHGVFWVSNLASPWLVLGFLAGWAQRSAGRAAATAVLTEVAGLMGFYSHFLVLHTGDPAAPPKSVLPRIVGNLDGWFAFVAPWLPAALAAGVVYGLLGRAWRRSRPLAAGVALGVPFVLEPWAWRLHTGFWEPPIALWFVETAVGLALLAGAASLASGVTGRRPRVDAPA